MNKLKGMLGVGLMVIASIGYAQVDQHNKFVTTPEGVVVNSSSPIIIPEAIITNTAALGIYRTIIDPAFVQWDKLNGPNNMLAYWDENLGIWSIESTNAAVAIKHEDSDTNNSTAIVLDGSDISLSAGRFTYHINNGSGLQGGITSDFGGDGSSFSNVTATFFTGTVDYSQLPVGTVSTNLVASANIGYPNLFGIGAPVERVIALPDAVVGDTVICGAFSNIDNAVEFSGVVRSNNFVNILFNTFATVTSGKTNSFTVRIVK